VQGKSLVNQVKDASRPARLQKYFAFAKLFSPTPQPPTKMIKIAENKY
jgi:hypothetical protein